MTRLWIKLWISGFAPAASVALGIFLIAEAGGFVPWAQGRPFV